MTTKNNIQWLDTLRALATVGVIIIHVSSPAINQALQYDSTQWWFAVIYNSCIRFSVPMFLMLSGATLLGRHYSTFDFYKRRLIRVLIPFVFWLCVYFVFRWLTWPAKHNDASISGIINWMTDLFLHQGVSKHLWYIYMILFLYLFIPIINKIVKSVSNLTLLITVIVWMLIDYSLSDRPLNAYDFTRNYDQRLLGYFMHAGYIVLGYYLSTIKTTTLSRRWFLLLFTIASLGIICLTGYLTHKNNVVNLTYFGYFTPLCYLQCVSLFLLMKDRIVKNKLFSLVQQQISNYSFGIYLVHIIIVGVLYDHNIYWKMYHTAISIPLLVMVVLLFSTCSVWLLRKLPKGYLISG